MFGWLIKKKSTTGDIQEGIHLKDDFDFVVTVKFLKLESSQTGDTFATKIFTNTVVLFLYLRNEKCLPLWLVEET